MNNWNILVIEDDTDGQEVVSRMLKYHRIPHKIAGTGEEALNFLEREAFSA